MTPSEKIAAGLAAVPKVRGRLKGKSHLKPGTDQPCGYLAIGFCNKCGWMDEPDHGPNVLPLLCDALEAAQAEIQRLTLWQENSKAVLDEIGKIVGIQDDPTRCSGDVLIQEIERLRKDAARWESAHDDCCSEWRYDGDCGHKAALPAPAATEEGERS